MFSDTQCRGEPEDSEDDEDDEYDDGGDEGVCPALLCVRCVVWTKAQAGQLHREGAHTRVMATLPHHPPEHGENTHTHTYTHTHSPKDTHTHTHSHTDTHTHSRRPGTKQDYDRECVSLHSR